MSLSQRVTRMYTLW